jgi:hypothetical protein
MSVIKQRGWLKALRIHQEVEEVMTKADIVEQVFEKVGLSKKES